ncbi:MAG: M28 family peptidase [Gemmatimonadota bacterium]|nr:M28 family peptidase [Gemmatimonadota bacterium]
MGRHATFVAAFVTGFLAGSGLFGTELQAQDRNVLLDAYGEVRDDSFDYMRMPLSAADRIYADIDGHHIKELMNQVVEFSRRSRDDGNKYWGRMSGTKYEVMTADWLEARYRALGLEDIHRVEFPLGPQWMPQDWTLTATGGGEALSFPSAYPSPPQYVWSSGRARNVNRPAPPSTLPGPISVEAIWVGLGTELDFAGRDVRGKAVVFQAMLAPGQMGNSSNMERVVQQAQAAGAAMTIGIWGYAGNMGIIQSTLAQQTPGFWMGFEDGRRLRDLIAEGPVTISASLDVDWIEGLTSPSQYGTLPGTTDETIIITAHMDGWFDAALDNASGVAVMMALAEHFSQIPREQRRRNMIFVGTAGHHIGSPNSPYMRDEGMLENTALLLNAEHIAPAQFLPYGTELRRTAGISPRRWWVHGSDDLLNLALDAYRTFGVSLVGPMHPSASGEIGSIDEEAPSIQLIRSPEHKHSDLDIPDLVPSVGLEAVARAFAKIIDGVNGLSLAELQRTRQTTSN